MTVNICPCQTGHEWHPNVVIMWRKYVPEVARFVLTQPDSFSIQGFIKWVLIIFVLPVDVDNNQPWSLSSEGEADQFTPSEMHVGNETISFISFNMGYLSSLSDLHIVGPPRASKITMFPVMSLLNYNLTLQGTICVRKPKNTHNALLEIATKTKELTIKRFIQFVTVTGTKHGWKQMPNSVLVARLVAHLDLHTHVGACAILQKTY